jgi:hypothetical protein
MGGREGGRDWGEGTGEGTGGKGMCVKHNN